MSLGLLGSKVGMMRVFTDDGEAVPVTVIDVANNRVVQVKSAEREGYASVQVAYGKRRASRVTKAQAGHFARAGVQAGVVLREFAVAQSDLAQLSPGAVIDPTVFVVGQKLDVSGTSIGKGFAGTIKRHNFNSGRASHGNSRSHNVPGSIGMAQDPGRVFPGKRMCGHLGDVAVTVQGLELVRVDTVRGLLFVRGAVPGPKGGVVAVRRAIKTPLAKGGLPRVPRVAPVQATGKSAPGKK